jgi:hypothetical protein
LSYISDAYILQVSDQLLVRRKPDGTWQALPEPAVKTVLCDGRGAFASTGLAHLPRAATAIASRPSLSQKFVPANIWLGEVLALPNDPRGVDIRLEDEIKNSYSKLPYIPERDRKQALVGVFWNNDGNLGMQPCLIKVTNINSTNTFSTKIGSLSPGMKAYLDSTRPLDSPSLKPARRMIAECVRRSLSPKIAARALIDIAREISRNDDTVGEDLILTCIPKSQVELSIQGKRWRLEQGEPSLEGVSYQYVPSGQVIGKKYSPTVVLGGLLAYQMSIEDYINIITNH